MGKAKIIKPTGQIKYLGHFAGEKVLREGHNTHEHSETVTTESGTYVNVYGRGTPNAGKRLDNIEYDDLDTAVRAAKRRSKESDEQPDPKKRQYVPMIGGARG